MVTTCTCERCGTQISPDPAPPYDPTVGADWRPTPDPFANTVYRLVPSSQDLKPDPYQTRQSKEESFQQIELCRGCWRWLLTEVKRVPAVPTTAPTEAPYQLA